MSSSHTVQQARTYYNDTWQFTLPYGPWERVDTAGDVPSGRWGHACVALEDRMLVIGGEGVGCRPLTSCYELIFSTMTWRRVPFGTLSACPDSAPHPMKFRPLIATHHTTLHCTTLRHITRHHTTLRYTVLYYTTRRDTALHCTALHCTALHCTALHCTAPHHTTQHNTAQHNTTQHNTTQRNATQRNTTQHNTTQHNTTQHNTTQHNTTQHQSPNAHVPDVVLSLAHGALDSHICRLHSVLLLVPPLIACTAPIGERCTGDKMLYIGHAPRPPSPHTTARTPPPPLPPPRF